MNDPIDSIYFIINGQVDMFLQINTQDVHLETLYKGCTIGAYGVLGKYFSQFLGKTSQPTSVYILDKDTLHRLRKELRDLDDAMNQAERHIRRNGIGLVDFRLYRGTRKVRPVEILKRAIRRTVLINRNIGQEIDQPDFLTVL